MRKKVAVGSRGSRLALIQAEEVLVRLRELVPECDFNLLTITTRGDRERKVALDRIAGAGVFVKELEDALLEGRIDLAVHSLKDMPTEIPGGLTLAAVGRRLDPRDVLVSRAGKLSQLAPSSRIGTSSLRRTVQLLRLRSDLKVEPVRGNVDTRLHKVSSRELDGVIVAAAAMSRLGWDDRITEYLSLEDFLPAVGQGALGIEIRADDAEMAELASALNHLPTWSSVIAERTFLRALGGGCRTPIAALGTFEGDTLRLEGMVTDPQGLEFLHGSVEGSTAVPEQVGMQLAQRMQEMGASRLIAKAMV